MASNVEIDSLDDINYKGKIKFFFLVIVFIFIFMTGFLNFYPINPQIKTLTKSLLKGTNCHVEWSELEVKWFFPKIVVSDVSLPASCFHKSGKPIILKNMTLNFNLISFSPFGIPFRVDTEVNGQKLSLYFVQSIGKRYFRLKDQEISLTKISPLLSQFVLGQMSPLENLKLSGNIQLDLSVLVSNMNLLKNIQLKAESKNLELPAQNIAGFSTPPVILRKFSTQMTLKNPPRLEIESFILGNVESTLRANFKGTIDIYQNNPEHSPLNLLGEISFTDQFKENVPIDLLFGSYPQKDGFYQIRLGGTLSAPKLTNP